MELNAEIYVVPNRLSNRSDPVSSVLDPHRVSHVRRLFDERREVADSRVSFLLGGNALRDKFLRRPAGDMYVDPDLVTAFATYELVDWCVEVLSSDVPQCDVDGTDGSHDRCAAKMAVPVHVLPVVLDP